MEYPWKGCCGTAKLEVRMIPATENYSSCTLNLNFINLKVKIAFLLENSKRPLIFANE